MGGWYLRSLHTLSQAVRLSVVLPYIYMSLKSKNSSPDTLKIEGIEVDWSQGIAFIFIGDVILYTYDTHANIFSALKDIDYLSVKDINDKLKTYDIKTSRNLTKDDKEVWLGKVDLLPYRSLSGLRTISYAGRIWKSVDVPNVGKYTCVSFWCDQNVISTSEHLDRLEKCFKIKNPILWEGSDSSNFLLKSEDSEKSDTTQLHSEIAPYLSHEELLDLLIRSHSDAMMSPFEKRIARQLKGMNPDAVKKVTAGYPSVAEYNYRSRFSEQYAPFIVGGNSFDKVFKEYVNSFNRTKRS